MRFKHWNRAGWIVVCALAAAPAAASAQETDQDNDFDREQQTLEGPAEDDDVGPRAEPDLDPNPEPPRPEAGVDTGLQRQAGTGGAIAYASAGVLELGGGGFLTFAEDVTSISIRPTVGWFFVDNLELSLLLDFNYIDTGAGDATTFGAFLEPSYHIPFTNRVLGFIGIGLGVNYNSEDTGFGVRPRLGVDILVGRSGIFRPSFDLTWSSVDLVDRGGNTVIAVSTSYGISLSYSVML